MGTEINNGTAEQPIVASGATGDGGDAGSIATTRVGSSARVRETPLTPIIKEIFLDGVAAGELAVDICRALGINRGSFYRWKTMDPVFDADFKQAMKDGLHVMDEDCLVIADDKTLPPEDRKVRIHTRLQLMARRASGTYADRLQVDGTMTTRNLNINFDGGDVDAAHRYADMMRGRSSG